jgi:Ca-activated chloride channel homolog
MTIDKEKLTAFALDELEGGERQEAQKWVDKNDEARLYVDAIRKTAGRIAEGLSAEPENRLAEEQRAEIRAAAAVASTPSRRKPGRIVRRILIPTAAAALLLVVTTVFFYRDYVFFDQDSVVFFDQDNVDPEQADSSAMSGGGILASNNTPHAPAGLPRSVKKSLRSLGYNGSSGAARDSIRETEITRFIPGVQDVPTQFNTEQYDGIVENPFLKTTENRLSTFSIDVDTASYSNMRRFINQGRLPPKDAVRIEELINYFIYDYPQPEGDVPFSTTVEIAACPWDLGHRLARIGLKGKEVRTETRPAANIVFLLDVSGSMNNANKLPLVKKAMKMLVERLDAKDTISIAVYAGASGLVLPATSCERKPEILSALDRLSAGGSTNGGAGIELAYRVATARFIEGGINRVILCTDGDFNVGTTDDGSLVGLIEKKAKSGVFLSVLGFGMGNYKDSKMEKLADKGNGNYAYIDTALEAKKVLCDQMTGTLVTIAKDVKIQVEFNPDRVAAYRLIGYENRMLRKEDFNDDSKDAGEIGAGHTVTALYELIPFGAETATPDVDPLRYRKTGKKEEVANREGSGESFFLKLRYKEPDGEESRLVTTPVTDDGRDYSDASADFKFAASVASFGMILRDSRYKGTASCDAVIELAEEGVGADPAGYRKAFLDLARTAKRIIAQK